MEYSPAERAILWLCACTEYDNRTRAALLRAAADPARIFSDFEKIRAAVIQDAQKRVYKGDSLTREREADAVCAALSRKGYFAVTAASDDYPKPLRYAFDPPLVLYGAGNRALLKERKFCIVGSRILPAWAETTGKTIASDLCAKFVVVTGFAEGGDAAAIAGALASGRLICVLPNGLDVCYPASHAHLKREVEKKGLLLTEYPPATGVQKYSFHARNRLLAGLSEGVLVLAAGRKSGALITADCALECGREVFALPHNAGAAQGAGCNELIKKGAYLCTGAEDIFSVFGMEQTSKRTETLSDGETRILAILRVSGESHAAAVAEKAGMPVFEVQALLASLELKGLAVRAGANRYAPLQS